MEILSRRELFKRSAKILPMLTFGLFPASQLIAKNLFHDNCDGNCEAYCKSNCEESCSSSCKGKCTLACSNSCNRTCQIRCSRVCAEQCEVVCTGCVHIMK